MKIGVKIENVMLLGVSENSYVSKKTGQPVVFYNMAIKSGSDVGQLSATKELYDMYTNDLIKDFAKFDLICEYSVDFRNLQVVGVHAVKH